MAIIREWCNGFNLRLDHITFYLSTGDITITCSYNHLKDLKGKIEDKLHEFEVMRIKEKVAERL